MELGNVEYNSKPRRFVTLGQIGHCAYSCARRGGNGSTPRVPTQFNYGPDSTFNSLLHPGAIFGLSRQDNKGGLADHACGSGCRIRSDAVLR